MCLMDCRLPWSRFWLCLFVIVLILFRDKLGGNLSWKVMFLQLNYIVAALG